MPEEQGPAVTIAYVHSHDCTISWHHSVIEMLAYDMANAARVYRGGWIAIRSGTGGLVESRNLAVEKFLEERQAEWMLWLDTDMGFAPDTVDRLLEVADPVERPVVGALCFTQRELESDGMGGWHTSPSPTIFDFREVEGQKGFVVRFDYSRNTVTAVDGTGSACILIHRSVFQKLEEAYGRIWYNRVPNTDTGQLIGEDLSFCLRARSLKIPIFVHTGVQATHLKPIWLQEEDYWRHRLADAQASKRKQSEVAATP